MPKSKPNPVVRVVNGRPVLLHDGQPISQAIYCESILRGDWEDRVREFVDSGVKMFHLTVPHTGADYWESPFWSDEDVYPTTEADKPLSLDDQAKRILKMQPDARFFIRSWLSPPVAWMKKHLEHVQTDEDGKTYREATLSSELFLRGLTRCLQTTVNFCESQPWGERVAGYFPLPYGEGTTPLTIAGKMFDCSPVQERAFAEWVKRKYRTVASLRRAWNVPTISFEDVQVPRDREWIEKRISGTPTIGGKPVGDIGITCTSGEMVRGRGLFHWIEAANAAREMDYCRFQRDMLFRWVRTMIDAIKGEARRFGRERVVGFDITKQPLLGWQIQLFFDGVGDGRSFPSMLALSGSLGVGDLLDTPGLDIIFTPADYHARTLGFAYEAEGVSDSLLLRADKTMLIENDARSYVGPASQEQGAFRDDAEVEAGLLRNAALTLSRGIQSYWANVGSSYFHSPGIHKTIAKTTAMLDRLNTSPHRETRDAIAFVIDDESPYYEDLTSGYQQLAVIWQRIRGLAHCGVPYRIFLLSDLTRRELHDYKVWFFPNLFRVDQRVIRLLRSKVLRNGNLAIFGPATGIADGTHLTSEPASELLGVPMELHARTVQRHAIVHDFGHPITRELPANLVFGDTLSYGPVMTPTERGVEKARGVVLGHANLCWPVHRSGLFIKEFGRGAAGNGKRGPRSARDYAVLWSCAMPLPASLVRAAARFAGCNIWCEQDDVIYASDSFVALHSMKAGPRTIQLPRRMRVHDALTAKPIGRSATRQIELRVRPPQTSLFTLE